MVKFLKNNLGVIFVVILAITPALIWAFMKPLSMRFVSSGTTFRSLGQLSGLVGMALLSINFVLATRFAFLDKIFNGLNRVYVKHHLIGALSFCLLLFHPTFLIIQFLLISLKFAFDFIFAFGSWALFFGKLGLSVFVILMVITFYMNFKYQHWKKTHQYLGLVLFLGGLHMLLIPSDISSNALLKYYMLTLATLGGLAYLYRTILGIYKKGEYKYSLEAVSKINDNTTELKLQPISRQIRFLPGQFVFIRFEIEGVLSESHPFSVTSSTGDKNLTLGIKTLGDFTSMVYLLKPGAICRIEGPFGAFSYAKSESKRQVWIAGGIGITPFLSMAREINKTKNDSAYKVDLYYSIKNASESAFAPELLEISKQNDNFRFHEHFSEQDGYITAETVLKNSQSLTDAEIFLCGPVGFMKSLRHQFLKLGFNNSKIHSEEFSLQT